MDYIAVSKFENITNFAAKLVNNIDFLLRKQRYRKSNKQK